MELSDKFIDIIKKDIVKKEGIFQNLDALNEAIKNYNELIMYVNIRSLNANCTNLLVFIESIEVKPCIIICAETRVLEYYKYITLTVYKMYYTNCNINNCNGAGVYIKHNITENTEIIQIGRLSILHSSINIDTDNTVEISAVYRSHDLPKKEFILDLKQFLITNKKIINHLVIGDIIIDLLKIDNISQEFLSNFLELGFAPGFQTITRPSVFKVAEGIYSVDVFIKTISIETKSFKLTSFFNDHYPLFTTINKLKFNYNKNEYAKIDYSGLNRITMNVKWDDILSMKDPNIAIITLIDYIQKCMELTTISYNKNKN